MLAASVFPISDCSAGEARLLGVQEVAGSIPASLTNIWGCELWLLQFDETHHNEIIAPLKLRDVG